MKVLQFLILRPEFIALVVCNFTHQFLHMQLQCLTDILQIYSCPPVQCVLSRKQSKSPMAMFINVWKDLLWFWNVKKLIFVTIIKFYFMKYTPTKEDITEILCYWETRHPQSISLKSLATSFDPSISKIITSSFVIHSRHEWHFLLLRERQHAPLT